MPATVWFIALGALFISIALSARVVRRMPLSTSVLYLAVGMLSGAHGLGWLRLEALEHAAVLERLAEAAVLLSLFTAGLKLSVRLDDNRWRLPLQLASSSMLLTIGLTAALGVALLHLPLGIAILLGAIVAPTDPVLASDVQVAHPGDRDRVRFALTGEAGMNDGTAFPFVMLGLGLVGLHPLGRWTLRWFAVDVLWAITAGVAIGALVGTAIGRVVVFLRARREEALGRDEFLTLGLVALSYGLAVLAHGYGFLAVFAAGLALRRVERAHPNLTAPQDVRLAARDGRAEEIVGQGHAAPAYMTQAVLGFNEQLERLGELGLVVVVASTLRREQISPAAWWFVPALLLVVRPVAVFLGTAGAKCSPVQRALLAWFGIRGIGSVYYLMFAINHGLPEPWARLLVGLTLPTIAVSIVLHGISVTPLMNFYGHHKAKLRRLGASPRISTAPPAP